MKINPFIFRNYDIRGIYPEDMDEEGVFLIVSVFAELFPDVREVVVARDSRTSSPSLAQAVISALVEQGKDVIDIGLAPDPLFSFATEHYDFDAGITVTASHNSKEYNGLVISVGCRAVCLEVLEEIKTRALKNKECGIEVSPAVKRGGIKKFDPTHDYISFVIPKTKLKRKLKIVFDSGNGAMGFLPEQVFKKLGCETITIFGEPDGNFPNHPPDPYLEENLEHIKREVLTQKADCGFAFDGDGDRVVLIDNNGRRVLEDYCFLLLAKHILKKEKGAIVHGMRISNVFLDQMSKMGVKTFFSVCHHNAVIQKIRQTNAVFGGEITSHYFFPKEYYLADDALFSALKLSEIVSQTDNFAEFIDTFPKIYTSKEMFINVPDDRKFLMIEDLKKYLRKSKVDFIDIDGARINFENGWALARASNTSPYIKIRFEGKTKKDLELIKTKSLKLFEEVGIKP